MNYVSTRDKQQKKYNFSSILLKGLADDGGLFLPEQYPEVTLAQLKTLATLSYADLAAQVMYPFVEGSLTFEQLHDLTTATYKSTIFGSTAITPLELLDTNLYLQDLSSGPSLAFKDMAMQFLGHLMQFELDRQGQTLTILGASSGDTVSAAEQAMRSKKNIDVFMLTPKTGMSAFQKAQAGSILDDNIFNISINGPFDLCQDLVKAVNRDVDFKQAYSIGAVNSINWGRILAQIVYYFNGYLSVVKQIGDPVDVCVPSGNFGNVLAAYMAKQMGLPLRQLIVSTNENVVLDHFFNTGIYQQRDVVVTSSPSMDISKASNIERLFYDILGKDAIACEQLMTTFEQEKRLDLTKYLTTLRKSIGFRSGCCSHRQRILTIKEVFQLSGRIIDPHTAAGVYVARQLKQSDQVPVLCMETAKPAKFEDVVFEALGFIPDRPIEFQGLEDKPQRFFDCEATTEAIKAFIIEKKI